MLKRLFVTDLILAVLNLTFLMNIIEVTAAAPSGSTYTPQVQLLFMIVIFFSLIIASIVFGLMAIILIRYRASSNVPRKKIQNRLLHTSIISLSLERLVMNLKGLSIWRLVNSIYLISHL
jgi:heme/copper-type cytochrome/quinol oxidase subunit 2